MTSCIYFIQANGDGPVKIGFTADDPRRRMVKIQSDCPWRVKLIGAIEGTVSQEKQIHLLLSRFKTQGEWFHPHPIVMAAVHEALKVGKRIKFAGKSSAPKYPHALCKYRKENDLTLKDVAALVNISHASLSRIESGRGMPSWDLACRLGKATGIPVRDFRAKTWDMLYGAAQ